MTPNAPTKSQTKKARRKINQILKLMSEVCELTGRNELTVTYEIQRTEPRPEAPPLSDADISPAELRSLTLNGFDSLLIAAAFPSYQWDIPARDLVYATVGSGSNERFTSPPRSMPKSKK